MLIFSHQRPQPAVGPVDPVAQVLYVLQAYQLVNRALINRQSEINLTARLGSFAGH
jgi:hypothetical protein